MATTISNPPYNLKWQLPFFASSQPRFDLGVPPESNANFAFILSALNKTDDAVFLLPNGVLSTSNKNELKIKENLVNSNYIEAVIALPGNMFESTSIPTCLIFLNKKKEDYKISMINLCEKISKETRKQRGQTGETNVHRVYEKELNVLSDELINQVLEIIENKTDNIGLSKIVSVDDVKAQEFNLSPIRYIDSELEKSNARDYEHIVNDLNRIISKKNAIKITINENMAKSLGLYELALDFKNGKAINQTMNEMLKPLNFKIGKEDVVSLTRYKEMKFEVKDFDKLPEMISIFLNMWRQQMMALNNEENRILIELRDTLLPDLMSGKINLEQEEE